MEQVKGKSRVDPAPGEGLEARVAQLGDELKLAITWNRPSILFAVCRSRLAMVKAQVALAGLLAPLDQAIVIFDVGDKNNADVPARLALKRNRSRSVFFVERLRAGGEAALRALNMRREYLVDKRVRAVFWMTEEEEAEIARTAPDFWAFRHRVVYLSDETDVIC